MQDKYLYIGCFFDFDEFVKVTAPFSGGRLFREIKTPHVTYSYKPESVDESLFGTEIKARVVGYGNDGMNEGFQVQLETENDILKEMGEQIPVPHITISVSADGHAVNTSFIEFHEIVPFEITGIFGGATPSKHVILQ